VLAQLGLEEREGELDVPGVISMDHLVVGDRDEGMAVNAATVLLGSATCTPSTTRW
jgi:hypothetical protein